MFEKATNQQKMTINDVNPKYFFIYFCKKIPDTEWQKGEKLCIICTTYTIIITECIDITVSPSCRLTTVLFLCRVLVIPQGVEHVQN